ncbi:MAG: aminotransferase class I/II-fold pyridoxal phosphate-dependent enzyme [Anaerolineae bacterium]|nr:aminotransferase class I/II-fold pyridoxal phosphate-dependent enzyme [Anaerolineae bacterium]
MPVPATRLQALPPYPFALLNQRMRALRAEGIDVINLDVGSPDMPPPDFVVDALAESAAHPGHHGYSGYQGTTEFRSTVAEYYQQRFGVKIADPDRQVLPLLGSKEGIINLSFAYLDRGDVALVSDISYPPYALGAQLAGADVAWLRVDEAGGYLPDFDTVPADARSRGKLLWVNYPNNPTGATAELDFYQRAVEFCSRSDILLASDNPYVEVTYDGYVAGSALQIPGALDCTIEFISFSKSYNMAGWRLGAAVGSPESIKTLLTMKSNVDSGHFRPIYDAAVVAREQITPEWIAERNDIYQHRRDRILETLPHIGLSAQKPKGSLYVWARVEDGDGKSYAEAALMQAHVSIAPGAFYGPGGAPYVRISLGIADDRLEQALERLKKWYGSR